MNADVDLAAAAALIADRARATMLDALLEGRSLTAGELAHYAAVTPATASQHLKRLLDGGLVTREIHGRHHHYLLASPQVAEVLEALARIARPVPVRSLRQADRAAALRYARTCYDHLAGKVGVVLTGGLLAAGALHEPAAGRLELTPSGETLLSGLGVDVPVLRRQRRALVRSCLDWSERAPHLAGAAGAALLVRLLALGWVAHGLIPRAVIVTAAGHDQLPRVFGCALPRPADH